GMFKLTPEQQAELLRAAPETFRPAAGAWGRSGSTIVCLSSARVAMIRSLMRQAWEKARGPHPARRC
nr:MmcQ/YjbR family DNA-binding protein [Chthoniobacterales bacterium]